MMTIEEPKARPCESAGTEFPPSQSYGGTPRRDMPTPISIRYRLRGELKHPFGGGGRGVEHAPQLIPSVEGIFRSPAKREMRVESGWGRSDLPLPSLAPAPQAHTGQSGPVSTTTPPVERLRVWDLALLWCFALILWCFLPEPLPTNEPVGITNEQSHASPATLPIPR